MEEEEEEEELPNPVRRIGARQNTAEAQQPGNSPRASPKIEKRSRGPKDGSSERRERRAGSQNMGDVVGPAPTKRAVRGRGPANPVKVRLEKKAVSITAKTREVATDRAGQGQLLRCYFGDLSGEKRRTD